MIKHLKPNCQDGRNQHQARKLSDTALVYEVHHCLYQLFWEMLAFSGAHDRGLAPLTRLTWTRAYPWVYQNKLLSCRGPAWANVLSASRSPGEGNGNPFQYSCLENSRTEGLAGYSPWVTKNQTRLSDSHTHTAVVGDREDMRQAQGPHLWFFY